MIRVSYTATRQLVGTHVEGTPVTLEFSATDVTPGREIKRDSQTSISGHTETLLHSSLRTWAITVEPLAAETLDEVIEFLSSVEGGETFFLEPWRYAPGPALELDFVTPRMRVAEVVAVTLTSEGYTLSRVIGDGTGGASDWYQLNFSAREVPG